MSRSQQASFLNHCPETIFPLCLICFILHPWNACLINVQFPPPFQKRVCETNKQLYISSQACYWQPSTCPFYLRHHLICTGINITWSKNVELVAKYIIHIWFVQFVLISTERQTAVCFLVCQSDHGSRGSRQESRFVMSCCKNCQWYCFCVPREVRNDDRWIIRQCTVTAFF